MSLQKTKSFRCNNYLRWIRALPCCHCMHHETIAHHIIAIGYGAMGAKQGDFMAFPLCVVCHAKIHNNSSEFDQLLYLHRTQKKALEEGVIDITWGAK